MTQPLYLAEGGLGFRQSLQNALIMRYLKRVETEAKTQTAILKLEQLYTFSLNCGRTCALAETVAKQTDRENQTQPFTKGVTLLSEYLQTQPTVIEDTCQ